MGTIDLPTRALRAYSVEVLRAGLLEELTAHEGRWLMDSRDLMVALAPCHDCVSRLGHDPVVVFADVADRGPASLADAVFRFGMRGDVTPTAFGFTLRGTADGPEYVWARR